MLSQPPRDANGLVVPHDHVEVLNEDVLIRRINPDHHIVPDGKGGRRISTKVIQQSSTPSWGMSVDHARSIDEDGIDIAQFVTTPIYVGSIAFTVAVVRGLGLQVGYDPIAAPNSNPYHCEVWGAAADPSRSFSKGQQRAILGASTWFVPINDVAIA